MNDSALGLLLLLGFTGCAAQVPSDVALPPPASAAAQSASAAAAAHPDANRQIIYRASVTLRVEDFGATEKKIAELVQDAGGHIAAFREDRNTGAQRSGHWTVQVPVVQFRKFLEQTGQMGVAEQRESQADDVTEEYVDLGARLKNKQQLEARLLELVSKRGDDIKDVLALEAELARVREEIERMQGRLRYLTDRVALTTIEITAYERKEYQPPQTPTFAARISHTFWDSVRLLREFGEAWVLVFAGLAPWLIALTIVLTPLVWLVWRCGRRCRQAALPAQIV
jgi:uncharacterized coiled-coil protein SlyX